MYAQIHTINPFDSAIGTTIKFTWKGNQIFKVRCIIKENESGTMVYDNTTEGMKPSYSLPPTSGLVNGKCYLCYITVFDIDGKESELQTMGTPFYCFSTPTFKLSVENGDVVKSSTYEITLSFAQAESETLDNYTFFLYSYQKTLLQSSGIQYNTTPPLSYTISNLTNATQYYVRATGTTIHGFQVDTGYILIHVSYSESQVWTSLYLNNRSDIGAIEINANIISSQGVPENPEKIKYIKPHFVDLTETQVEFDEGFDVSGDFSIIASFYKPKLNSHILFFDTDTLSRIFVYYREGVFSDQGKNPSLGRLYYTNYSSGIGHIAKDDPVSLPYSPKNETYGIGYVVPCVPGKHYTFSVTNPNENAVVAIAEYKTLEDAKDYKKNIGFVHPKPSDSPYSSSYTSKGNGIILCWLAGKWTNGNTTLHECTKTELLELELGENDTPYERKSYFELRSGPLISPENTFNNVYYSISSNYVDIPQDTQEYSLLINRIGGLYNIKAILIDKSVE